MNEDNSEQEKKPYFRISISGLQIHITIRQETILAVMAIITALLSVLSGLADLSQLVELLIGGK